MRSDEEEPYFGEELDMDRLLELLEDQTMPQSVQDQQQHDSDNLHNVMGETAINYPLLPSSQTMQSIHRVPVSDHLHDTIRQTMQSIHRVSESNHLRDTICQVGLDYLGQQIEFKDDLLNSDIILLHGLPSPPVSETNEDSETNKELLDSDQPHDAIGQIEPHYLHHRIVLDFDPIDQESGHSSQSPPMHEPIIPPMYLDPIDQKSGHSSQSPPMHEPIIPPMYPSHGSFWGDIRFHGDQESSHNSQSPPTHEPIIPPINPSSHGSFWDDIIPSMDHSHDSFWDDIRFHGDQESGYSFQSPPMYEPIFPPINPSRGFFLDDIRSFHEMINFMYMDPSQTSQQENYLAEVELFNDLGNDSQIEGNPPASQSVTDNLPSVVVAENTMCAVCGDNISLQKVATRLPCLHEYHKECILPWLGIRNSCPMCRYELPTDNPEYERSRRRRTNAEV